MTINLILINENEKAREIIPQILKPYNINVTSLEDPILLRDLSKFEEYNGMITEGHLANNKTYLDSMIEWFQAGRYSPILVCSDDRELLEEARHLGLLAIRKGIYIESHVNILREYF